MRVLVACAIAVAAYTAHAEERQWMRYRHDTGRLQGISRSYSGGRGVSPGSAKLPEFKADDPKYFRWKTPLVESDGILVALDRSRKKRPYDRLYVDTNADGHLVDEQPHKPTQHHGNTVEFNAIKVVLPTEEGTVTYHLSVHLMLHHGSDIYVSFGAGCWYENEVRIGDETKFVRLVDRTGNGVFNDKASAGEGMAADRIYVKEGKTFVEYWVADLLRIGESYYRFDIARDGAWVEVREEQNVQHGTIRLMEEYEELQVAGESGFFNFKSTNRVHRLPVGKYASQRWIMTKKDQRGARWRMESQGGSSEPFAVEADKETRIQIGFPLRGSLRVSVSGNKLRVRQSVRSSNGGWFDLKRNRQQAPAPKLRVLSADGAYDRTHVFRRGRFNSGELEFPAPPDEVDAYTVTVEYPGPFPVEVEPYRVGPKLHVATHPLSTNAIEILWEINRLIAYDGKRLRTCTGAFTGRDQEMRLAEERFDIFVSHDGKEFQSIGSVHGPTNRFVHADVPPGHLFYYRVHAVERDGTPWGESAITMGAAGVNLVAHPTFESFSNGVFGTTYAAPDGMTVMEGKSIAIEDGSRPFIDGQKVLVFDPKRDGKKQVSYEDAYISLSTNATYLTGAWVLAPGNAWYGRMFQDANKKAYSAWGYSLPAVRDTPHWTFGVQALTADSNWMGHGKEPGGPPKSMARKQWTFPAVASYMRPFMTAFGLGKLDDHWIIAVTNAPTGAMIFEDAER